MEGNLTQRSGSITISTRWLRAILIILNEYFSDMKPVVKFSKNWNQKLNCDSFPIIRPRNDLLYQVNGILNIQWEDTTFDVRIDYISHFMLDKMSEAIARLCYGCNNHAAKTILERLWSSKVIDINRQEFSFIVVSKINI